MKMSKTKKLTSVINWSLTKIKNFVRGLGPIRIGILINSLENYSNKFFILLLAVDFALYQLTMHNLTEDFFQALKIFACASILICILHYLLLYRIEKEYHNIDIITFISYHFTARICILILKYANLGGFLYLKIISNGTFGGNVVCNFIIPIVIQFLIVLFYSKLLEIGFKQGCDLNKKLPHIF